MSLTTTLTSILAKAWTAAGYDARYGEVVPSERPDLAQFQCNGALAAAREYNQPPRVIAESVAAKLQDDTRFAKVEVAGPGFINLTLTDAVLAQEACTMAADPRLITPSEATPRKTIIDYGGPNVAKPLHVGHLRASIIGETIKRLHRFMGNEVIGDIHLGDWGTPMGILIAEIAREQPNLAYLDVHQNGPYLTEPPVSLADLERLYPQGATRFKEDTAFRQAALQATRDLQNGRPGYRALWQHFVNLSIEAAKQNFDRLSVSFDWWYGESHYHDRIAPLVQRLTKTKQALESEGALIIPLQTNNEVPPLVLVKSDGAYLYATTDLAAIEERVQDDHASRILYVVDQRQSLHFAQVFQAARQTGIAPESVELAHLGFGTVNGPDGRPFKTRTGGVMKLHELIDLCVTRARERMQESGIGASYPEEEQTKIAEAVGIAALKFADLINGRQSDYSFDVDRFVSFEGKTGPYLIYTAVRIQSIFRKADLEVASAKQHPILPPNEHERQLILTLSQLPNFIEQAYRTNTPHHLAEAAYRIAQEFNRFYQRCHILSEENEEKRASWLALSALTLSTLELLLSLLAIPLPERM